MKPLFLVVFISIFVLACSKDDSSSSPTDPKPSVQPDVLLPLAVGNLWYYDAYYIHSTKPNDTLTYYEGYTQIQNRVKVGKEYWYAHYDTESTVYLTNRTDGLYQLIKNGLDVYLLLNYPTFVGDRTDRSDIEVITRNVNAKVKVPAGEFTCIMYELIDPEADYPSYVYYCPKVGMVYHTFIDKITGQGATLDTTWSHKVLTKYELK